MSDMSNEGGGNMIPLPKGSTAPAPVSSAQGTGLISVEQRRAIAEVQGAILVAQQFPRNRGRALDMIAEECTRPGLAQQALYSFSRGGTEITGPTIRLMEVLAQNWGNVQFGWSELSRVNGESEIQAWAWDVETNVRRPITFHVKHVRNTKRGSVPLTDERDIYELCANQAARRMRSCMQGIIPGYVVEAAVEQCEATLANNETVSPETVSRLVNAFADMGVSKDQIEKRIQRNVTAIASPQIVQLRKIYNSLRDGMSKPEDWFEPSPIADAAEAAREDAKGPPDKLAAFEKNAAKDAPKEQDYAKILNSTSPLRSARHKDWNAWVDALKKLLATQNDQQRGATLTLYRDEMDFIEKNRTADYEAIVALDNAG